ncbi:MAG: site-specific integrase [Bacteroidetes bacterium]|nr:site-specific integrase [Bacteroidota bacterium]MCY4233830.1 site-specific integrase [Bacteroidota bacterium]
MKDSIIDSAEKYRKAAYSDNTRLAYIKAWKRFLQFCVIEGIEPEKASAADIVKFFVWLSSQKARNKNKTLSTGTLKLYRSALNRYFNEMNVESPALSIQVSDVLGGLSRIRNDSPRRVKALREYEISSMLSRCPDSIFGMRDAAMLALGFAAALRRSELCSLFVEDANMISEDRMILRIRRSKTDQQGVGQMIAVLNGRSIMAVSRLKAWIEKTNLRKGYLFQTFQKGGHLSGKPLNHSEVPRLVKKYVEKIGLCPDDYSGHSLRAGFVTSAAVHNARLDKIMEVTRHRNPSTVLQYIRDASVFEDHAGAKFL